MNPGIPSCLIYQADADGYYFLGPNGCCASAGNPWNIYYSPADGSSPKIASVTVVDSTTVTKNLTY